jgi:hypothetical protein
MKPRVVGAAAHGAVVTEQWASRALEWKIVTICPLKSPIAVTFVGG